MKNETGILWLYQTFCACVLFIYYVSEIKVLQSVIDGCALLCGILTRSLETTLQLPPATWHCGLSTHTHTCTHTSLIHSEPHISAIQACAITTTMQTSLLCMYIYLLFISVCVYLLMFVFTPQYCIFCSKNGYDYFLWWS